MSDRPTSKEIAIFLIAFVVLVVAGKALYAHAVYGDWTCGFAHCVKIR